MITHDWVKDVAEELARRSTLTVPEIVVAIEARCPFKRDHAYLEVSQDEMRVARVSR